MNGIFYTRANPTHDCVGNIGKLSIIRCFSALEPFTLMYRVAQSGINPTVSYRVIVGVSLTRDKKWPRANDRTPFERIERSSPPLGI